MKILNNDKIQKLIDIFGDDAQLHLVGGAVRDEIMGLEPKDLDFATKFHPKEVIKKCKAKNIRFIETGIRRGTITVVIDGEPIEITTFRNYNDENQFTETIEEDLTARDFTINAIAINVHTGEVVDPFGGKEDIKNKRIKAVGEQPQKRFMEDPHRAIRMCRFAAKFDFSIEGITLLSAIDVSHRHLTDIAIERIQQELVKILTLKDGKQVVKAIHHLDEIRFFDFFIPELNVCKGVEQNHFHSFDVFNHILKVVEGTPNILVVRLAALLHDIAKPATVTVGDDGVRHFLTHEDVGAEMAKEILVRLKFPNDVTKDVCFLIKQHMRSINMKGKGVRKLIRDLGEHLDNWMLLKHADKLGGRPEHINEIFNDKWNKFLDRLEQEQNREEKHPFHELAINGNDVLRVLRIKPGKKVGKVLNTLMDMVLENPEINERENLLNLIKELPLE